MGRPYAVKGKKKRKRVDGSASRAPPAVDDADDWPPPEEDERKEREEVTEGEAAAAEGIPILPRLVDGKRRPGAIFVLERACLEVGQVGRTTQILNSDDHAHFLMKKGLNPADYRPDIIYQALLAIFDSPLAKAGRLQAVYVRTEKGVLFEIKPHVRLPRTFKRFCGLMSQLLQKFSIMATRRREKLLNVIKNPVTDYLPVGAQKIGLSYHAEKSVDLIDYVAKSSDDEPLVFVVGAMARGKIENEYSDDYIQICNYPLSAACCLNRICGALEQKWNIR